MPRRPVDVDFETWLRVVYPIHGAKWIAEQTGRTVSSIRNLAYRRGITVNQQSPEWRSHRKPQPTGYTRPEHSTIMKRMAADGRVGFKRLSPERFAELQSKGVAAAQKRGHPRGMLGKRHSESTKARMSATGQARVARGEHPGQRPRSPAHRAAQSAAMQQLLKTSPSSVYSRCHRGRRADLGDRFFRSRWEANYARFLRWKRECGAILAWEYEPDTFWFEKIRRGVRSYTPDFRVTDHNGAIYYVEVKGWMDKKSATKLRRMTKYHPAVDIRLFDFKAYRELERKMGSALPGWEAA